jgi:hypothetical protein
VLYIVHYTIIFLNSMIQKQVLFSCLLYDVQNSRILATSKCTQVPPVAEADVNKIIQNHIFFLLLCRYGLVHKPVVVLSVNLRYDL